MKICGACRWHQRCPFFEPTSSTRCQFRRLLLGIPVHDPYCSSALTGRENLAPHDRWPTYLSGGGPACRVREVTRTAGFRRCSGHGSTCPLAAKDAARSIDWTFSGLTTEEVRLPAARPPRELGCCFAVDLPTATAGRDHEEKRPEAPWLGNSGREQTRPAPKSSLGANRCQSRVGYEPFRAQNQVSKFGRKYCQQARGRVREHERRRAKAICVWKKGVRQLGRVWALSVTHPIMSTQGAYR